VQNVRVDAPLVARSRGGLAPAASLARAKLLEFGVTAVPVLDDEHRPAGLVSLRDLAHADDGRTVTEPVRVVRGGASVEDGARILAEHGAHQLVVVDEGGRAILPRTRARSTGSDAV
jgi:CBS domain-containing protein